MKFFVPRAESLDRAMIIQMDVRHHLAALLSARLDARRVFRLKHAHDGRECEAQVGRAYEPTGEEVLLIFHELGRKLYHVCTLNRGVRRGQSIFVGENEVHECEDFEDE